MTKQRIIFTESDYGNSGITIDYVRSRNVIYVSAWYDSMVSIQGGELSLAEFFQRLGIRRREIERAMQEMQP